MRTNIIVRKELGKEIDERFCRRGLIFLSTLLALLELAMVAAQAQTCMTEDLFLCPEAKKPIKNAHHINKNGMPPAKTRKNVTGAGIAVVDSEHSQSQSKASDDRREQTRQQIAGRN